MAYTGVPRVIMQEVDLSTRIPGSPGVFGGIVIGAKKGPLEPVLISDETQFLKVFTPDETIKVGYDSAYFSALAFLQKSKQLWVRRVIGDNYKYPGLSVNKFDEGSENNSWANGEADPTAHQASDDEVFSIYAANPGEWGDDVCVKIGLYRVAEDIPLSETTVVNTSAASPTATLGVGYEHVTPAVSAEATLLSTITVTAVAGATPNSYTISLENDTSNSIDFAEGVLTVKVTTDTTQADLCTLLKTANTVVADATTTAGETAVGEISEAITAEFSGGEDAVTVVSTGEITATFVAGNTLNGYTLKIAGGASTGEESVSVDTENKIILITIEEGVTTESTIKNKLEAEEIVSAVTVADPDLPYTLTTGTKEATLSGGVNASTTIATEQHWATGEAIRFVKDLGTTLPEGIEENTTYYTIADTDKTVKLAKTLTNALEGVAIVLTETGSGKVKMVPLAEHTEPDSIKIEVFKRDNLVQPVETWYVSRNQDAKDGYGRNMYIENILKGSDYIRAIDNPILLGEPTPQVVPLYMAGGDDGEPVTDANMIRAAENFLSVDRYQITVLMDGGWATPSYQRALDGIAEQRGDCVAYLSTPYANEAESNFMNSLIDYRKFTLNMGSSRSALFTPHLEVLDKYNNRYLYVSPDGYAAAALAYSAMNAEMWYPPAGFNRGMVNAEDCFRRFTETELGVLYDADINPIKFSPGRGIVVWGQKTLLGRPTALDRLNVRLLLCVIEPAIVKYLEDFLFELNDEQTRSRAKAGIDSYMDSVKARRGVYAFETKCSDENNTPEDIDNYQMNVDLYIQPTKAVEYIRARVIITRTGVSFG